MAAFADAALAEPGLEAVGLPDADFAGGTGLFGDWAADGFGAASEHKTSNIPESKAKRTLNGIPYILVPQNWRGVRIFAESFAIALRENFHHPAMEVINRLIENGMETAVIFFSGFVNIAAQSDTDVLILTAEANFLGPEQLDILHGNFGHAVRTAVQILNFTRKRRYIESGRFRNGSVLNDWLRHDLVFHQLLGRFRCCKLLS